ncbi:MAG: 1,3-beta-glucanase, partial [Jatrophihabitans sp.]
MIPSTLFSRVRSPARRRLALIAAAVLVAPLATAAIPAGASPTVPAPPAGWSQLFAEDFSGAAGSSLNTANWLYDSGTSYPGGAANWGTGEVETVTNSTANVY